MIKELTYKNKKVQVLAKNPKEYIQKFWWKGKFYEKNLLAYIEKNYRGGTFIDVGACIGNHTLFFSKFCDADKVFSFEPVPDLYEHLRMNVKLNHLENVVLFNIALGNSKGKIGINKFDLNYNVGLNKIEVNSKFKVKIDKLDDVMGEYEIKDLRIIKIDTEGFNVPILKGSVETISKYKPDIFVECESGKEKHGVKDFLEKIDYGIKDDLCFNETPTFVFMPKEKLEKEQANKFKRLSCKIKEEILFMWIRGINVYFLVRKAFG